MNGIMFVNNEYEKKIVDEISKEKNINIESYIGDINKFNESDLDKYDAVIGYSPKMDREVLQVFAKHSIKYYITRSTGFNHIDLLAAKEFGIRVANVRAYSPNAIAELALALVMDLNRKVSLLSYNIHNNDFSRPQQLAKEIRDCTIGILGTGSIGIVSAKYYQAIGAKVIGYDKYPDQKYRDILEYQSLQEVIENSDILLVHLPYIKEETHYLINKDTLSKAKSNLIIVNTARGELVNLADIVALIKAKKIAGYGADVFEFEERYIGKKVEEIDHPIIKAALKLYPKIILTPHIGASTERAIYSMNEIAIENFVDFINTGECKNEIIV